MSNNSAKINWIIILQGWSMLLVIAGHAGLSSMARNPNEPIISLIEYVIYSFHMPLFMVISGYLFYLISVSKKQSYVKFMSGKLKKLGIPFLFFTVATLAIKPFFNSVVNRPTTFSLYELVRVIIYPSDNPLGELWFINALFWMFVMSPIIIVAMKKIWTRIMLLLLLLGLHYISIPGGEILGINSVFSYFLWFYIGVLVSRLDIYKLLYGSLKLVGSIVCFFTLVIIQHYYNVSAIAIFTTIAGCIMSFSLAINADKVFPLLFSSFRNYTYQIFLMGIFFQAAFKIIYQHILAPDYYGLCYIICILLGVYTPVLISKIVQRINSKYISPIIGL